jgi:hypothetical protein
LTRSTTADAIVLTRWFEVAVADESFRRAAGLMAEASSDVMGLPGRYVGNDVERDVIAGRAEVGSDTLAPPHLAIVDSL